MRYILTSILALAGALVWWQQTQLMLQSEPQPEAREGTVVVSHEKSSFNRILREQWIESMHRAAPGVNWREQDLGFRMAQTHSTASRATNPIVDSLLAGEWFEKGSNNQSGRVVYALFNADSNEVSIASDGGIIWQADIDLLNWKPINDHFRINGIVSMASMQIAGKTRLAVASSERAIFYTEDNGTTWKQSKGLENLAKWGSIRQMSVCNNQSLVMVCNEWDYTNWTSLNSIYFSSDGGENFQLIQSYDPARYGPVNYFDLHSVAQSDSFSLFLFRDSVSMVSGTTGKLTPLDRIPIRAFGQGMLSGTRTQDSLKLYAYIGGNFYSSNGEGKKWSYRGNTALTPFRVNSFSTSQVDTSTLFFGGVECFRSTDGGDHLTKVNEWFNYYSHPEDSLHADIPFISRFEDKQGKEFHLIGTDGGVYLSNDQLQTVKNMSLQHLNISQYYSTYSTSNGDPYLYAGSQDQGFQRGPETPQSILNFDQIISGDYGHLGSNDGGQSLWLVYPGFVGFYDDARKDTTFSSSWDFSQDNESSLWMPPVVADPHVNNKAYLIGVHDKNDSDKKSVIIDMVYTGSSITTNKRSFNFNISAQKDEYLSALAISPLNKDNWYAMTNKGNFYFSTDAGNQWVRSAFFTGPEPHYFYGSSIYASRFRPDEVWVAGSGYSNPPVYRSNNGGRDFTPIIDDLPRTLVYDITGGEKDSSIYAATEVGPYVWIAEKNTWYPLAQDVAPDQVYWSVEYLKNERIARFGTYGRGIWDYQLDSVEMDNSVNDHSQSLASFQLFPNPANTYVHLSGKVLQPGETVHVYDLNGKLLRSETIESSEHIRISVEDLSEGTYLVRLGQHTAGQKMVIRR